MSNSGDLLPNNLDINLLYEPTIESRRDLEKVFDILTPLAQQVHMSEFGVSVTINDNDTIEVDGRRNEWRDPGKPEGQERIFDDLGVVVDANGSKYRFGTSMAFNHEGYSDVLAVLADLTGYMSDDRLMWLRNAVTTAIGARDEGQTYMLPDMTDLIKDCPVSLDERIYFFVSQDFENGSHLVADWSIAEDDTPNAKVHPQEVAEINLACADGSTYNFKQFSNGDERLFIKKPGERAPINASADTTIRSAGFVIDLNNRPDLMQEILERREAREKGIDVPTEGDYQDLLGALEAALTSGLIIK